ncbi:putative ribonuclease H protein [Sesamum angolense]|uniref:Ribonuclease H protein n=1 Tax=Sesamum angolense TaxID=2727404 RepID=A0AAE1T9W1_9LAMI|nr:putative ribonuclease H protein [Sesamum angolense]
MTMMLYHLGRKSDADDALPPGGDAAREDRNPIAKLLGEREPPFSSGFFLPRRNVLSGMATPPMSDLEVPTHSAGGIQRSILETRGFSSSSSSAQTSFLSQEISSEEIPVLRDLDIPIQLDGVPSGYDPAATETFTNPSLDSSKTLTYGVLDDEGLSTVASGVGTPLYTDGITKECSRLDYARVCVMLDYNSTLPKHLVVISPVLRDVPNTNATAPSRPGSERTEDGHLGIDETGGKEIVLHNSFGALDNTETSDNCWALILAARHSGSMIRVASWNVRGLNGVDHQRAVEQLLIHCRAFNKRTHTKCLISVLYGDYDLIPRRDLWGVLRTLSAGILEEPCEGARSLWKRLDRMLVNEAWLEAWPDSSYICALPIGTDMYEVVCKLKALKADFRKQRQRKGNLTENVKMAKSLFGGDKTGNSNAQTACQMRWMKHGDQNSKVFFRKINSAIAKQWVFQITKATGEVLTGTQDVTQEFISYFQSLLGSTSPHRAVDLDFLRSDLKHTLTVDEANLLDAPVTQSDIKDAFFAIDEDSAPGPDGYTLAFLKSAWPVIGHDISEAVGEFFRTGKLLNRSRALRQGDPLSPYLFVLVVEIWSTLIRYRVQRAAHFQYHWKCKKIGLMNLCFADDVLLFCKADLPSIQVLRDTLTEFAALSGLNVNPAKSQIILSRAVQHERRQIVEYLGFQEGSLPVRYLGVPLTSSRLTIADCRPLINRIDTRLAGWNQHNLSYAGRVQLIKSVLSSLHTYWASVFILPKGILKIIEGKMRKFLWQGASGRGNAKVAWDQICKPKEEGGLGIRSMLAMNQALMLKHLWRILQNDGTSIWVDWIQHYRLRNSTIWTFNGATGSWSWKKLIKLRPLLQSGVCYKVGNGSVFSLWQDIWHARGPLCLSFPRGPALTGLPINSLLSSVLQQDQWRWPASTEADIAEIISQLPPTNPTTSDQICWRNSAGKYTVQSAILLIQPTMQVQWHGLLRGKFKIARHCFFWLAILEKLSTLDKPWISSDNDGCVLCDGHFGETHGHLFFECLYSRRCLTILKTRINFNGRDWNGSKALYGQANDGGENILLMWLCVRFWHHWYITYGLNGIIENSQQQPHQRKPYLVEF